MKTYWVEDTLIIYYYEKKIKDTSKVELEKIIKSIFLKLKQKYNLKFEGYYEVNVYMDPFYGSIFEIRKEDFEYFFSDSIEMQMNIMESNGILYKVEDIPPYQGNLYEKDGCLYFELTQELDFINHGKLLEMSEILYNEEIIDIRKNKVKR